MKRSELHKQRIAINLLDLYSDSIIYTGTLSGGYHQTNIIVISIIKKNLTFTAINDSK